MLKIAALGGLSLQLEDRPAPKLASRKADALLVYLAECRQPQTRESLAGLFWGEFPQSKALANLRVALSSLNTRLPDYVSINRYDVALRDDAPIWYDGSFLEGLLREQAIEEALVYYRGDFLDGFALQRSPEFESWVTSTRERYRRLLADALHADLAWLRAQGACRLGVERAQWLTAFEPLDEAAHRHFLYFLAATDQRARALATHYLFCQLLEDELGVQPDEETHQIFKTIRDGSPAGPPIETRRRRYLPQIAPAFLRPAAEPTKPTQSIFLGREPELARLTALQLAAHQGRGQVALVCGEAGAGKTSLVQRF